MDMDASIDIQFPILLTLEEASQGTQRDFFYPSREMLCSRCGGGGRANDEVCHVCDGTGRSYIPKKITVTVPAGVNDQVRLRISGQGLLSPELTYWGDLYLICYLRPHALFKREAFDIIAEVNLDKRNKGRVSLNTLSGPIEVEIPEGFNEVSYRLPGLGLPRRIGGGERGDLVIRFVPDTPRITTQAFQAIKAEARNQAHHNHFQRVIELLARSQLEYMLDAEAHALLGVSFMYLNKTVSARDHLELAITLEPTTPSHRYNLGVLALREEDYLGAAVCFESAINRNILNQKIQKSLTYTLSYLFNPKRVIFEDQKLNDKVQYICNLAQHRSYLSTAEMLKKIRKFKYEDVELLFMEASARLLACLIGNEELLPEAFDLFDALQSIKPKWKKPQQGLQAISGFVERDCGLLGLISLALYQIKREKFGDACYLMRLAAMRVDHLSTEMLSQSTTDPLIERQEAVKKRKLEELRILLSKYRDDSSEISFLKGLVALVECHDTIRRTGMISIGWLSAIRAVQNLELAVCQSPDNPDIVKQFHAAVDLFNGIASAILREVDPDQLCFLQNTYDAAIQRLIPESPINQMVQLGSSPQVLQHICKTAYQQLFENSRTPLRGEFLIATLEDHFVLTNYRLLLVTDRLPLPQLLPLNAINRYTSRAEGLNISTVIIGLEHGRQLILNNMPNGAFPSDSLMSYLIAARMWEMLKPPEQHVLETGQTKPLPEMLPSDSPPGMQSLPPGATTPKILSAGTDEATFCSNCGNTVQPGDVFCRQCGNRVAASSYIDPTNYIDPTKMLGSGG